MLRFVSIIRQSLLIAGFGSLVACPPSRVNPVTGRIQQQRYERLTLGFGADPPRVVFLELTDGHPPIVRQHFPDRQEEADLFEIDASLAELFDNPGSPREVLIDQLKASSMGGRLEAQGVQWAQVESTPVVTELGTITRHGTVIEASADDATRVTVATVGGAVLPQSELWLTAPDRSLAAVELLYPGTPRVRDLHVFMTRRVDARLALLGADQALDRDSLVEARQRLEYATARLSPGDSALAAVAFARARLAAREGDVDGCVAALVDATAKDTRYRDQAAKHSDFDRVRDDPRFVGFLALAPR